MNFYLIQLRAPAVALYTEGERLKGKAAPGSDQLVDRWLLRLTSRQSRWAQFLSRLIVVVRDLYHRLEHKIDPMERVFKRLRHASELTLFHSPSLGEAEALEKFRGLLLRQRNKHVFWIGVDLIFTIVAILLSPFLIPVPGPNVFLYYPGLRMLSHYLAWRGTTHGLHLKPKALLPLDELSDVERILGQRRSRLDFDRLRELAQRMKLEHLPAFLERYS